MTPVRYHAAARHPRQALLVALLLGALSYALFQVTAPLTAVALSLLLWASLADYFLPCTYELAEDGLQVRKGLLSQRYPWGRLRRVVKERRGVLLSPFTRPHPLENFRGLYLPMDPESAEELVPELQNRVSA